jgi:hypothetical protein
MSNDLAIQPLNAARTNADIVGDAKAGASQQPPQPEPAAASPSPIPNPSLRFDPALGLVVLEFRGDTGAVTTSIPSQRQLQAYQKWDATHFGPEPTGARGARAQAPDAPAQGSRQASAR